MVNGLVVLLMLLFAGCASSQTAQAPPRKSVSQYYLEAHERHYASLDKWMKGISESNKCLQLGDVNRRACLDQLPPPASFLPKDRQGDETIREYMERKNDEWDEKACFYKGHMEARYLGENQRIEDQCKRDLEIKRLRKAMENLNKQK